MYVPYRINLFICTSSNIEKYLTDFKPINQLVGNIYKVGSLLDLGPRLDRY